jgi:hypothetical protein
MSAQEREFRSKLAQCIDHRGLLRGSLLVRRRVCGKPRCRCVQGQLHESLYLVISQGGRTRQLFVPRDWEERVRQWVQEYHHAQDLLEEISQIYWGKVRHRQD